MAEYPFRLPRAVTDSMRLFNPDAAERAQGEHVVESPFPSAVKVGWLVYTIEYVPHEDWPAEHADAIGVTRSNAGKIIIRMGDEENPAYAFTQIQETLLHEILHACFHVSTLHQNVNDPADESREEHIVAMLSGPLLSVMMDNPHLVAFLADFQSFKKASE